ncbi:MAG: hypothetical protein ACREOP_09115, partial [Thermodesulfobacteriota bacterium]
YIRSEYIRILEERFDQLAEVSDEGFKSEPEGLMALVQSADLQLSETRVQTGILGNIEALLKNVQGFAGGTEGLQDFGTGRIALLHGREAVLTEKQLRSFSQPHAVLPGAFMNHITQGGDIGDINVTQNFTINATSTSPAVDKILPKEIARAVSKEIRSGNAELRKTIQEAVKKGLN